MSSRCVSKIMANGSRDDEMSYGDRSQRDGVTGWNKSNGELGFMVNIGLMVDDKDMGKD